MLLHKQGRFYSGGVSFALPDDCYLVIAEALNYHENGLEITDQQGSFNITISTCFEEMDAKSFLDDMLTSSGFIRLSETRPVKAGELDGYSVMYHDKRNTYCEYHFDLEERDYVNRLVIFIFADKGADILSISNSKMVTEILKSLKKTNRSSQMSE